jgi:hypothetical protein
VVVVTSGGHTGNVILSENTNFLGDDLIVWLLLALGGALLAGNVMALVRPPQQPRDDGDLTAAPRGRSILMAVIGLVVVVAALGGLIGR